MTWGTGQTVAVIGTLDTKGDEIGYVRGRLVDGGFATLVIDSGILGTPNLAADVPREDVARAAGRTLADVQQAGSRSAAVEIMEVGLARVVRERFERGALHGVLCLGGAEGALMGAAAMHALPVGVPKVIVSPSASGRREFGPFMGSSDVLVMHSVVDILGLNAVARSVFDNAVAAVGGMVVRAGRSPSSERPCIGITMLGQTTPGAMVMLPILERAGYEPIVFHANGVGGPAMDAFVRDGLLQGVIDLTLSEPVNSLFDGIHATDETRMTAAVDLGLPLLVVPGAADFFNQGPVGQVGAAYRDRPMYRHNPVATLVRVNADELRVLGRQIADRLRGARAPTEVHVPMGGFSLIGVPGGAIHDTAADEALADSLEAHLPPWIPVRRSPAAINDVGFAEAVARRFLDMMAAARTPADLR